MNCSSIISPVQTWFPKWVLLHALQDKRVALNRKRFTGSMSKSIHSLITINNRRENRPVKLHFSVSTPCGSLELFSSADDFRRYLRRLSPSYLSRVESVLAYSIVLCYCSLLPVDKSWNRKQDHKVRWWHPLIGKGMGRTAGMSELKITTWPHLHLLWRYTKQHILTNNTLYSCPLGV